MPCLTKTEAAALIDAIYYCTVPELKALNRALDLSTNGQKQILINRLLETLGIKQTTAQDDQSTLAKAKQTGPAAKLSPDRFILPHHYTNGHTARALFKAKIGAHFRFTNYGMQWIRDCWAADTYPTYSEFAAFWQAEYARRQTGGAFTSAQTNAWVRFLRANKGQGLSQAAINQAWQKERHHKAGKAQALILKIIKQQP